VSDACIVCGGTNHSPLYTGIVKCDLCGFVCANLRIKEEEILRIYQKNYFFGDEYSNYQADREVLERNFKLRLEILLRLADRTRHRRLFEIGSAYGFFLALAKHHFESVQGIDITQDGVQYSINELGLDVRQGDLLAADLKDQEFDVVCLWDTIEHLRTPNLYIEKISEHMGSGSLLAITTGDIESLNARVKKERWRLLHPPTHLQYFSRNTLTRMLNRLNFDVIYQDHCGFYRSFDNAFYNLFVLRCQLPFLYRLVQKLRVARWKFYLNLYDIMYVIAKKR
jgi:SAM-dependent methyltransferase